MISEIGKQKVKKSAQPKTCYKSDIAEGNFRKFLKICVFIN
jgi:hypothetical protein